jgi:hypothetical protein
LLKQREQIRGMIGRDVATSVTAFLAWKAFLITAKSVGTGSEKNRCIERIAAAVENELACRAAAAQFAFALQILCGKSNVAIAEWVAVDDDDVEHRDRVVLNFKRDIHRLTPGAKGAPLAVEDRFTIARAAFAIRNAVIAHGSVHSTGDLFGLVVPAFDEFVCAVACQGYAQRLAIPYEEANHECSARCG